MKTTLSFLTLILTAIHINSSAQAQSWDLDGQNTSGEFIGTLNAQPFIIRTTDTPRLTVAAGGNIRIGTGSPTYLLDVNGGDINLANSTDFYRVAGWEALHMDNNSNLMVGTRHALPSLSGGEREVLVGRDCGLSLTTGDENTFVGDKAGKSNTEAENGTFIGFNAGTANTTGSLNTFVGNRAGLKNTEGNKNVFLGYRSGENLTGGDENLFAGSWSGSDLSDTTGNNKNVILGFDAGHDGPGSLSLATKITIVGYNAEASDSLTNAGAIGANAYVEASNALVLGAIAGINDAGGAENTNVGIGTTTPDNRLEIVRGAQGNNVSGLRLWSLVGSTPDSASGAVLSIDGNGDVILVSDTSGVSVIGNYCPETQNPLTDNYEIPLGDYNYYFSGLEPLDTSLVSRSDVGIGMDCNSFLSGKLHVHQENISFPDQESSGSAAGYFNNTATEAFRSYGVFSEAIGVSGDLNFGGRFEAKHAEKENVGVEGVAVHPADNFPHNYGGRFFADSATNNYGIWAEAPNDTNSWAAYINGNGFISSGSWSGSDRKLKKDIEPLVNGLGTLMALRPTSYEYDRLKFPSLELPRGKSYGLIAQELEDVIPELVRDIRHPAKYDQKGRLEYEAFDFKGVNYMLLLPFTIAAIQEQQRLIEEKDARIADLEKEVIRLSRMEGDLADIKERLTGLENRK